MWRTLHELREWPEAGETPSHPGLAYSRWAPREMLLKEDNKQSAAARDAWLEALCRFGASRDYARAYARWRGSFRGPETAVFCVRAESRLLLGHGNPSPTEVGLTLHHTWGVPVLPGSSLKGLTASYVEATYGPVPEVIEDGREAFCGVEWRDRRPVRPPGAAYRRLFGAPDVDVGEQRFVSTQGEVIFHDALWVPNSVAPSKVLARDVLTVHQREYYSAKEDATPWPSDYDDPNPVAFLTVAPGNCFLVALEVAPGTPGGEALLLRARRYLHEALEAWGVGGKTAAGYGRFKVVSEQEATPVAESAKEAEGAARREIRFSPLALELKSWLEKLKAENVKQKPLFQRLEAEWQERLVTQDAKSLEGVERVLSKAFNFRNGDEQLRMEALLRVIRGVVG
ncbi:type III-B CRISPR module RAMP protein Cmr6 [Myxococcus sp. K15C18031901]|uniref:type III-B CRISPR module RAMP protein Cmr6 n=1 Tax=Myxococcus dinghuensis TaxID=2906761 RepID=UPI0020A7660C|nr:type III-B CRISPR module RAMP protein Cmr6 [Myxococcus dinghuensis]MCP3103969.1 type III-B CRISPR module RAMP protein Cmr6 [Myxococcus dinghuensis]